MNKKVKTTRDGHIIYDSTSVEQDETGVYMFFWRDKERVAIKRLKDFSYETDYKRKNDSYLS